MSQGIKIYETSDLQEAITMRNKANIDWREYTKICYWNLREKFLCGQKDFTKEMWDEIEKAFGQ